MFVSKEIISIIFRIINFIAILWLVRFLFKKAGLPILKEKLAEQFALFRNLEDKYKNLVDQNALVKKEIKDQNKLFDALNKKIDIWNNARKEQEKDNLLIIEEITDYHNKRINAQTQNIQQQKLINEVFPRVIKGTYKQLEKKFEKEEESKKFLGDIISYMKKNTHELKRVNNNG